MAFRGTWRRRSCGGQAKVSVCPGGLQTWLHIRITYRAFKNPNAQVISCTNYVIISGDGCQAAVAFEDPKFAAKFGSHCSGYHSALALPTSLLLQDVFRRPLILTTVPGGHSNRGHNPMEQTGDSPTDKQSGFSKVKGHELVAKS